MNTRSGCIWISLAAFLVAATGLSVTVLTNDSRHAFDAAIAAGIMGLTGLVCLLVEGKFGCRGSASIVTFWFGTTIRGGVMIPTGILGNRGLSEADSQTWWLWLLAAYVVVLTTETVWLVRTLDRQTVSASHTEGEQGS